MFITTNLKLLNKTRLSSISNIGAKSTISLSLGLIEYYLFYKYILNSIEYKNYILTSIISTDITTFIINLYWPPIWLAPGFKKFSRLVSNFN